VSLSQNQIQPRVGVSGKTQVPSDVVTELKYNFEVGGLPMKSQIPSEVVIESCPIYRLVLQ